MKEQSGRSMIEIIGVLAIGVIMIAAAYNMYKSIDNRQKRLIASETIADVAKKTKILYEFSGYTNASINDLVAKGAMSDSATPIGSGWSINSESDGTEFSIRVTGLSYDECKYFSMKKADWAYVVKAGTSNSCTKNSNSNQMWFFVK